MVLVNAVHFSSSRRLLRSLRELMVTEHDPQRSLNHMVSQIAAEMVADVCSIYLRRNDGSMELCATEGLASEAVHNTRLKPSEGLVGLVADEAAPISLSDAPQHKRFAYRPETGEDPYQSFLGVPMLKAGRLIGVLVVQNKTAKSYPEEDIETLQNIATVLAGIVSESETLSGLNEFDIKPTQPETFFGKSYSKGLVKGFALLHAPEVAATKLLADDTEVEEARLKQSLKDLRNGLDALLTGGAHLLGAVPLEVLEMFALLAQDRSWEHRLIEGVRAGLTAEASVEQARSEHRAKMAAAKDSYLRDRLHDLEELDNRLLRHLAGTDNVENLIDDAVLVARDIGPAELLEYTGSKLKAVLLEEGSTSSHAAIIARAMGLPMIGQMKGLLARVQNGDPVIVDGITETAYLRYDPIIDTAFKNRFLAQSEEMARLSALKNVECKTKDGVPIHLFLNAGLVLDLENLEKTGAEGVGLFRTEFQFMVANSLPRVDAQTKTYSQIMELAENKPVTFRTLDLGGDKIARFMNGVKEENPAMGFRALRLGLDKKSVLSYQLRAILRATENQHLRVMFPLVSMVEEFLEAKKVFEKELEWALKQGRAAPSKIEIGAMVEAPSIAWNVGELARHADFLSIGTNDLMQFFFAADRGSPQLSDRYDILSYPMLSFLKHIREQAGEVPISICGEHASRPLEALAFIGLGYDRLSMPSSGIGAIKELILKIDAREIKSLTNELLAKKEQHLRSFYSDFVKNVT